MAAKYSPVLDPDRLIDVFQNEVVKAFVNMDEFKKFARAGRGLCLDENEIENIIKDNHSSVNEQKLQMLMKWEQNEGTSATAVNIRSIVKKFKNPASEKENATVLNCGNTEHLPSYNPSTEQLTKTKKIGTGRQDFPKQIGSEVSTQVGTRVILRGIAAGTHNNTIISALSSLDCGKVRDVKKLCHNNTSVYNGDHTVIFDDFIPERLKVFIKIEEMNVETYLPPNPNTKKCTNCLKSGHFAKNCVNDTVCRSCKKPGHRQKVCTEYHKVRADQSLFISGTGIRDQSEITYAQPPQTPIHNMSSVLNTEECVPLKNLHKHCDTPSFLAGTAEERGPITSTPTETEENKSTPVAKQLESNNDAIKEKTAGNNTITTENERTKNNIQSERDTGHAQFEESKLPPIPQRNKVSELKKNFE